MTSILAHCTDSGSAGPIIEGRGKLERFKTRGACKIELRRCFDPWRDVYNLEQIGSADAVGTPGQRAFLCGCVRKPLNRAFKGTPTAWLQLEFATPIESGEAFSDDPSVRLGSDSGRSGPRDQGLTSKKWHSASPASREIREANHFSREAGDPESSALIGLQRCPQHRECRPEQNIKERSSFGNEPFRTLEKPALVC